MNPKSLPMAGPARARCPVCREVVYSRAGIHPQCAVRQSEAPKAKVKTGVDSGEGAEQPVGGEIDSMN